LTPTLHEQRDQPEGVPPLALTGERTLPDVPEENYWFRRHLVVYEWIAAQVAGMRVIDMACGEHFPVVEMRGLFHARKLRAHELALRAGWDGVHSRLGLTRRFYDWFTPAIACSDFVLRDAREAALDRALDFVAVCHA